MNSYTLEVSVLGYRDEEASSETAALLGGVASASAMAQALAPAAVVPYTEDMYCRVGRNVARAFWDYFKIMGFIPIEGMADCKEKKYVRF